MSAAGVLEAAFAHHIWATNVLLDVCEGLSEQQLATTVPGVFGSIIDTLRHVVDADQHYLAVLAGHETTDGEDADVARLRQINDRSGTAWVALLAGPIDADRMVTRHREDGSSGTAPVATRLAQALHHGTDHRSQVCTALTELGITPPAIDVWDHADTRGLYTETPATE